MTMFSPVPDDDLPDTSASGYATVPDDDLPDYGVQQPEQRTIGSEFGRQLGLTGRYALQGVGNVLDTLSSPIRYGMNLAGAGIEGQTGEAIANMLNLPQPENRFERTVGAGAEAMAGGAIPIAVGSSLASKAVSPTTAGVGEMLAKSPKLQAALSALSGVSSQSAKEGGAGTGGQIAAGIGVPVIAALGAGAIGTMSQRARDIVAATMSKKGATEAAGRVAVDVLGDRATGAPVALRSGQVPETAAQSVAPATGSAEFAGLERLATRRDPSNYGPFGKVEVDRQRWIDDAWKQLNAKTGPVREQVLQSRNNPLPNSANLMGELDNLRLDPANSNRTAQGVIGFVQKELGRIADKSTGEVDLVRLYNLRKDIGLRIEEMLRKGKWDKDTGAKTLSDIQKSIDFEIEKTSGLIGPKGNSLWREGYMDPFANRAQEITKVSDNVEQAAKMGSAGSARANEISRMDAAPVTLPNVLSRPVMVVNFLMKMLQGYGGERAGKEIARLMLPQNKAELASIIEKELALRASRDTFAQKAGSAARVGAFQSATQE